MVLHRFVQQVYENSIDGRMFTAECWTTMSFILNCTPSIQGAMRLPRMCTLPVLDVQGPPPFSYTGPYSGCIEILLTVEC